MRWLLFVCITLDLFAGSFEYVSPSTSEEIASLNEDLKVEGIVSAISGSISLSEVDLYVKGAQNLDLRRTYIPPQVLGRYDNDDDVDGYVLAETYRQLKTKGWVILPHLLAGYNNNSPYFQITDPSGYVLEFEIQNDKGILKTDSYGCSNFSLGKPSSTVDIRNIELVRDGECVKIILPSGHQRHYFLYARGKYKLKREILPNGKEIRYEYNRLRLQRIYSCDPTGKHVYASIKKNSYQHFIGSDQSKLTLNFETRQVKGRISERGHTSSRHYDFSVLSKASNPFYPNKINYTKRMLLSSYDAKAYPISCTYYKEEDLSRVHKLITPSGITTFSYDPPKAGKKGGSTKVIHPNGSKSVYRFNKYLLPVAIENWNNKNLCNQKKFSYNKNQHLQLVETKDGKDNLLIKVSYECDGAGNPLLETKEGDFGTFSIRRTFSQNRLASEMRDDGLGYKYTYLDETHLPTTKTTLFHERLVRTQKFFYDESYNLIEEVEVGKTRITYSHYQTEPHLHCIHWKEERDWAQNLLRKIEFIYDQWGNVSEERHFGSDGKYAFTIGRKYDAKGNLLEETNPMGDRASYHYDRRNRVILEEPFSKDLKINKEYDSKGRLTKLQKNDHISEYSYNSSDDLVESTDYLGLKTCYQHHPIHSKPISIEVDPLSFEMTYDSFGRETLKKDVYGAITNTRYNSYGDPLEIIYPDGGKEMYSYYPNGLLSEFQDPDGLKTNYTYDPLGRITSKTVGDLATTYKYDAFHLIEEVDPAGYITKYKYSLDGKKIEEEREGRLTRYQYDTLGYLASVKRAGRKITYRNDPLGRVILKSIDNVINTAYTYDAAGNNTSITTDHTTCYFYDPHNRLIRKIDPEGHKTSIQYDEGDQILAKITTDPNGTLKKEVFNAHHKLLKKEVNGLAAGEFNYDDALRLISHDHLSFTYTPEGNQSSLTEGNQRITSWSYTPTGKVSSQIKPDGTYLAYHYDSQGRLCKQNDREFQYDELGRLISGTGFQRKLDPYGNIIREDFSNGLWVESTYDEWNRPLLRILPDESQIIYEYEGPYLKKVLRQSPSISYEHVYKKHDKTGRVLSESSLFATTYTYDKTGRRTSQSSPYYSEEISYDAKGNVLQKGLRTYTYDDLYQLTSESGKFTSDYDLHFNLTSLNDEKLHYDSLNQVRNSSYDLNGNLLRESFIYDEFDQLIEANGQSYSHDALGRRLQKGTKSYLYIDNEEIAEFVNNKPKELKIIGDNIPVVIEIDQKPYVPVIDVQNTIRMLVDFETGKPYAENDCDTFGDGLTSDIPYAYASKRYDSETNLIYFGKRYYDPSFRRWLTTDPKGPIDHSNLYQYVYNNPFYYQDPTGESIGGFLLGIGEIVLGGTLILTGGILEIATLGGYTVGFGVQTAAGAALIGHGLTLTSTHSQDILYADPIGTSTSYPCNLEYDSYGLISVPTLDYNLDVLDKRSSRPNPDPQAEGNPHTIIQVPGPLGQYTTHNGDGTYKQYRGSGKPHGPFSRPNVKETTNNLSPTGLYPGRPIVRPPKANEIPKG